MKKTFIKLSLTLCALFLISVPAQVFAAEKPADASSCNLKTLVNQEQLQQQLQDATSKLNLNCKTGDLVKGINFTVTDAKGNSCPLTDVKGINFTTGTNCPVTNVKGTNDVATGTNCPVTNVKGTNDVAKGTNCPVTTVKGTNDVAKNTNCTIKDVKGVTTTVKTTDTNKDCTVNKCDSAKNCAVNKCENNKTCKINNCNDKSKACKILAKKGNSTCPLQSKPANNSNNTATKPADNSNNNVSTKPSTTTPTTKPSTTTPSAIESTTKPSTTTNTNASIGSFEQQVANLVNKERAANGLPALKVNTNLSAVAEKKAEDMRDNNYFSHTSPTYGSPFDMMKQFGISYRSAGENIAKGQRTPEEVMNGWMNSPGHRANILNADFTEIGIGYVTDSNGNTYWVQQFIRP